MVELIYCFCIIVAATGGGRRALRWLGTSCRSMAEELAFAFGLGLGLLALTATFLGLIHLLYEGVLYLVLLVAAALGYKELIGLASRTNGRLSHWRTQWRSFYFWVVVLVMLGILMNLTRALTPAYGAVDPLAYHLALPKIFLKNHYLSFDSTINGVLYPSNISMLFAVGIGLRGAVLAQLLHFAMGMGCLFAIVGFCRRHFDLRSGVWAMAIFSTVPVLVFFAPLGYVDVGLCLFQFLAFWALFNWLEQGDARMLLLAGVFTGLALGSKHPALPMWGVGLGLIAGAGVCRRTTIAVVLRQMLLFSGVALLLVMPWYLRSWFFSGNPVWPLANDFFHGFPYRGTFNVGTAPLDTSIVPSGDRIKELLYVAAVSLWNWSWNPPGWQQAIGIYFVVFLPGLLVYARHRRPVFLTGFCLLYYLVVVFLVDGNPRYSLFLFAFLSVLAGYVAEQMTWGRLRRFRAVLQTGFCLTLAFTAVRNYAMAQNSIAFLLSGKVDHQFLLENEASYRMFHYLNQNLPDTAVVLFQGIVEGYYCDRQYLWDHPYQMVVDYRALDTPEKLLRRLRELGVTHVARMIYIPPIRQGLGYPQYFADPFHEAFRKKYLRPVYRDESYVLFEVQYPTTGAGTGPGE